MADGLYADGGTSLALLTDMYQITMAQGYWKLGKHTDYSVFHLYYRKPPFGGTYVVSAGLDTALEYLSRWGFSESDISYLRGLRTQAGGPVFEEGFLAYLATLKVNVTIHGVPEGELVFPNEPILRVEGPLLECQILETPLLTILGFQSLVATKTTRVCQAAAGTEVMDFGLRRAHGPDGGVSMSRAAFVGGCCGTSNMLAGKLFGIPVLGTHSHSWVMSFEDEEGSFDDFSLSAPDNTVCLVDTYDTLRGVEKAIRVGLRMKEKGQQLHGIRLDSGDLAELSIKAREMLDSAGLQAVRIVASDDLDEYRIEELLSRGARIDLWGVGTRIATCFDQPALGCVYKLAAIDEGKGGGLRYCMKAAGANPAKASIPGKLHVRRILDPTTGEYARDIIYDEHTGAGVSGGDEVLKLMWEGNTRVCPKEPLSAAKERTQLSMKRLPGAHKRFTGGAPYPVSLEERLSERRDSLRERFLQG
eukprot:Rhum_TRINITY_DN14928_c4_g2::Rhum_TRINITY_DN14928_c4_g2_i1::g.128546::m.128546/K00763/pncB, NAPRT1; nicotinate phosphoribosyltransferase